MSVINSEIKIFAATKAFVIHNGKVLLLRESGKYVDGANVGRHDVVGGRVEPEQRFDASLLREIKEETGLEIKIGRPFFVNEWRPVVRGEQWQIVGTFFECFADSENVVLSSDHDEYVWIDPKDYKQFNIIENLQAAFESYLDLKKLYV
ncbi:MAG TPA: NUDIX domain-containing protein [Candidatus Udaeobacter sp.]|nr:NUDIX domain-containing protein [Candidatus Udaeobacter sp.]